MRRLNVMALVVLSTVGAAAIGCDDDPTDADTGDHFSATLTPGAEVTPPAGSPAATGTASLVLNDDNVLDVTVTVTGTLTSNVTMAHIHGPATTTTNASVVLDFVPSMTTVINAGTRTGTIVNASFDLDALTVSPTGVLRVSPSTLIDMLNNGQAYVNVHTATNGGGEIRGQVARN